MANGRNTFFGIRESIQTKIGKLDKELKNIEEWLRTTGWFPSMYLQWQKDLKKYKKDGLEKLIKSIDANETQTLLQAAQEAKADKRLCQGSNSETEKLILQLMDYCQTASQSTHTVVLKPSAFSIS